MVCSFGDASANHSTAVGAINTAINTNFRGLPVPILFVCEDNGWGVSVPTPSGWIESAYGSRAGLDYLFADGADPAEARAVIMEAVHRVRDERRPVFLHLRTVRFLGHAGSDAEISYRTPREVEADYARDPLLATALALRASGADPEQIGVRYDQIRAEIDAEVDALRDQRRARLGRGGDGAARDRGIRIGSQQRRPLCAAPFMINRGRSRSRSTPRSAIC